MYADLASTLAPGLHSTRLQDLAPPPAALALRAGGLQDRPADPEAVREAAQQLESFFLTMLLQEMREPHLFDEDEEGLFVQSREERMFLQQLDQALGDELARTGQLGLAEVILRQLQPEKSLS